jgi:hypothetical protein
MRWWERLLIVIGLAMVFLILFLILSMFPAGK